MKETYSYSAGIEIKHRCGVLVVGGGPAGVMAAVSAAREDADVILAVLSKAFPADVLIAILSVITVKPTAFITQKL